MRLIKLLGSVKFALLLIALSALAVVAGTVIESSTGSHKAASRWIYGHPLFLLLLWGFFVNILMASLKRWPFQKKHIPFLITHLGLLMVIAGTLLKISFGTQGSLTLKEGLAGNRVVLDDTWALSFKKRGDATWQQIKLKRDLWGQLTPHLQLDDLSLELRALAPHGQEEFSGWIKDGALSLLGHAPIPLGHPYTLNGREVIAAQDPETLKKGLSRLPALVFLQDPQGVVQVVAVDAEGAITHREYDPKELKSLYAYDEGRGGYSLFFPVNEEEEIETPLSRTFSPLPPPAKAEEERPLIAFDARYQGDTERLTLAFLSPLPTPLFDGEWLVKFEPETKEFPHTIRVRSATATLFPNTSQPESYSAELYVDKKSASLSMNRVWESPKGWRLYLANLSPLDESQVKQVRLVVNHDPFKWWLTYPGALILALGIGLLFFKRR